MTIELRQYGGDQDYRRISDFLIRHHRPGNADGNWLEPAWEYMHFHPHLDSGSLDRIGIWEEAGEIVAVCHYESTLGEAFFEFHPEYRFLRAEMLDYAERHLTGISRRNGKPYLAPFVNDNDPEFTALVRERGYERHADADRPMYRFHIPQPFPPIEVAPGFLLTSLAEEPDWAKVHQVMWRGFNHGDDVPMNEEELEGRRKLFDTPKARRDLKVAVAAPNGDFVAFCGMFYEPAGGFAYVEPVATDPAYRRMGLGKAAVLEGIRRCGALGATIAYVGSDQPFYQAIGFGKVYISECWVKYWD
jgi:predicted N-acetyltransferase YhbS